MRASIARKYTCSFSSYSLDPGLHVLILNWNRDVIAARRVPFPEFGCMHHSHEPLYLIPSAQHNGPTVTAISYLTHEREHDNYPSSE